MHYSYTIRSTGGTTCTTAMTGVAGHYYWKCTGNVQESYGDGMCRYIYGTPSGFGQSLAGVRLHSPSPHINHGSATLQCATLISRLGDPKEDPGNNTASKTHPIVDRSGSGRGTPREENKEEAKDIGVAIPPTADRVWPLRHTDA